MAGYHFCGWDLISEQQLFLGTHSPRVQRLLPHQLEFTAWGAQNSAHSDLSTLVAGQQDISMKSF